MALFKKKLETVEKPKVEVNEKLSIFITVVPKGQGHAVTKLFYLGGSNAQYIELGEGTAVEEIRDILGIEDNSKEIIFSIIPNSKIDNMKKELEAFFLASNKNKGIGFSIPMTSLIGMKVYQFLTATV